MNIHCELILLNSTIWAVTLFWDREGEGRTNNKVTTEFVPFLVSAFAVAVVANKGKSAISFCRWK